MATSGGTDASAARGERARYSRLDVTVKVVDDEDKGKVKLTAREPQVGKAVTATLSGRRRRNRRQEVAVVQGRPYRHCRRHGH